MSIFWFRLIQLYHNFWGCSLWCDCPCFSCSNPNVFFFIRIKFTRVHKNISMTKPEGGSGINNSLTTKVSMIYFTDWTLSKFNELVLT